MPDEHAQIDEMIQELASLTYELEQERAQREHAAEAHELEVRRLSAEIERLVERQAEQELVLRERADAQERENGELRALIAALSQRLDAHDGRLDRSVEAESDLDERLVGLSRVMDEVFDDVAEQVELFGQTLDGFETTVREQEARVERALAEGGSRIDEGLAAASAAAERHAAALAGMDARLAASEEARDLAIATLTDALTDLEAAVSRQVEPLKDRVIDLGTALELRLAQQATDLRKLDETLEGKLASQSGEVAQLRSGLAAYQDSVRADLEGFGEILNQLASQGQMLAQALESVQQGSINAEIQINSTMREQYEFARTSHEELHRRLGEVVTAIHQIATLSQQQVKELEAKAAKALNAQHGESQELERHVSALRDDHAQLATRVGTIVQLLAKATRPSGSSPIQSDL